MQANDGLASLITGKPYAVAQKILKEHEFYADASQSKKTTDGGTATWWHGFHEHRGKMTIEYTWTEIYPGVNIPGTIKSATWTGPQYDRFAKGRRK